MKQVVYSLLLLLAVSSFSCGGVSQYVKAPGQMAKLNNAVVALVDSLDPMDPDGEQGIYCSGVFVEEDLILTAAHCVEEPFTEVKVATYSDYKYTRGTFSGFSWSYFTVVKEDEDADLALLTSSNALAPIVLHDHPVSRHAHSYLDVASSAPVQGERVVLIGHPTGLSWTLTAGVVSSNVRDGWDARLQPGSPLFIQHDTGAYFGNSGGPLINHRDQVAGILVQGHTSATHLSMSVHTSVIHEFLGN